VSENPVYCDRAVTAVTALRTPPPAFSTQKVLRVALLRFRAFCLRCGASCSAPQAPGGQTGLRAGPPNKRTTGAFVPRALTARFPACRAVHRPGGSLSLATTRFSDTLRGKGRGRLTYQRFPFALGLMPPPTETTEVTTHEFKNLSPR